MLPLKNIKIMQTTDNSLKMQASFTPQTLADGLGIDIGTLKRAMTRMDFYYGKDDPLPPEVVQEIIAAYAKPHPRRPEEVVESAQEIAQQFNIQVNIGNPAPERKPQLDITPRQEPKPIELPKQLPPPPAKEPVSEIIEEEDPPSGRSPFVTILVYMAFIFILLFQMEHVASIGMDVSALGNETARKVSGWLFAFTFNLTALLMTLRRGISAVIKFGENNISYILLFAILDVVFFVMSAAPMDGLNVGLLKWAKAFLVGSATAFVIYSFNELLTDKQ